MLAKTVGLHSLLFEKIENLEKELQELKKIDQPKKEKDEFVDTIGGRLK